MRRTLHLRAGCRTISVDGVTDTVNGWAQRLGVTPMAITVRLKNGWSEREAVTTPRQRRHRRWGPRGTP